MGEGGFRILQNIHPRSSLNEQRAIHTCYMGIYSTENHLIFHQFILLGLKIGPGFFRFFVLMITFIRRPAIITNYQVPVLLKSFLKSY